MNLFLAPMDKRTKAIIEARSWLGTPWQHNKKDKGRGVDCINFLHAVGTSVGVRLPPIPDRYQKTPLKNEIENYLKANFSKCQDSKIRIARVLLLSFQGYKTHIAIATSENWMIHACNFGRHHKVIEHPIDGIWKRAISSVWEVKEWASLDECDILGGK